MKCINKLERNFVKQILGGSRLTRSNEDKVWELLVQIANNNIKTGIHGFTDPKDIKAFWTQNSEDIVTYLSQYARLEGNMFFTWKLMGRKGDTVTHYVLTAISLLAADIIGH